MANQRVYGNSFLLPLTSYPQSTNTILHKQQRQEYLINLKISPSRALQIRVEFVFC